MASVQAKDAAWAALEALFNQTRIQLEAVGWDEDEVTKLAKEKYTTVENLQDAREASLIRIGLADALVDKLVKATGAGGAGGPGPADLASKFQELEEKLERESKKRRADVTTLQRALMRQVQRTVTTWADAGEEAMGRASVIHASQDFPHKTLPLPAVINPAFKRAWQRVTTEPELQPLAFKAVKAIVNALRQALPGFEIKFYLLDTHASGYYKNPIAKIDIALSASPTALWLSFVMPIELKTDLASEVKYKEAVGQLLDRFEKMREECPARKKMLGVAWGRTSIDFWRFDGGDEPGDYTCAHTGPLPFDWDAGSVGYQMLTGLLSHDLTSFGYIPMAVPAPCNVGGVQLSEFAARAGTVARQRLVYTAQAAHLEETVVVKIGTQEQMAAEVELLQRFKNVTPVLPEVLGHGLLPQAFNGLTYAYVSRPLGAHMEESMGEQQLLSVMEQVARGLEELAKGTPQSRGMLHRDISPDNMVVVQQPDTSYKAYLLDLHVARRICDPGHVAAINEPLTGKRRYWALRLEEQGHSLATDLESLFYSFLEIASGGQALRWRRALDSQAIYEAKFATMFHPPTWQAALNVCKTCRRALDALHDKIFGESYTQYLKQQLTADDFVSALKSPSAAQG